MMKLPLQHRQQTGARPALQGADEIGRAHDPEHVKPPESVHADEAFRDLGKSLGATGGSRAPSTARRTAAAITGRFKSIGHGRGLEADIDLAAVQETGKGEGETRSQGGDHQATHSGKHKSVQEGLDVATGKP